jgi:hypothetical protein
MSELSKHTRNSEQLGSFVVYCELHPDERFWQALRNWAGVAHIVVSSECPVNNSEHETFSWEGRND